MPHGSRRVRQRGTRLDASNATALWVRVEPAANFQPVQACARRGSTARPFIEAVSCGLPGTQMPSWLDGAYTQRSCYGFPPGPAPDGTTLTPVLSANEVEALVDYLLAKIVGQ